MADKEILQSAEVVKTSAGKQYHIALAPGEVAPYILLCGDPARAERVSQFFDKIDVRASNREYLTFTGTYKSIPISVMATGIGCGNTEIAVIELLQCIDKPAMIRIGSCGTLQSEINLGDLIISSAAVRLENISTYFVPEGYPALVHQDVLLSLIQGCKLEKLVFHVGLTATSPGFYGGQARNVPGFPLRYPNLPEQLGSLGVLNFEMESSTLFTLASIGKARAGAVCAVYANRPKNIFVGKELKDQAELSCIKAGLASVENLYKLDQLRKQQNNDPYWYPWYTSSEQNSTTKKTKKK